MKIDVEFAAQLRELSGHKSVTTELPDGQSLLHAIRMVAAESEGLQDRLLSPEGELQSSVLAFVNDQPVDGKVASEYILQNQDTVLLLPPISGG